MAHSYKLVDADGTELKNLNSGNWALWEYEPVEPSERTTDVTTLEDGGERPQAAYSNIKEPAKFYLTASSVATLQSELNDVQKIFAQARRYQRNKMGQRIYLLWQPDGAASAYRSEILGGKYLGGKNFYHYEWVGKSLEITLEYTRRFYWEGPEAEVPLTNPNGTDTTGGLKFFNCNDGGGSGAPELRHNYVELAADDVGGQLPTPAKLIVEHLFTVNEKDDKLWVAHNVDSDPENLEHILESEDATGGSDTASAIYSGGHATTYTAPASETTVATWALSTDLLEQCAGNYFKILLRFSELTNFANIPNVRFRFSLQAGGQTVWTGPAVQQPSGTAYVIVEYRALRLPPKNVGGGTPVSYDLLLSMQSTTGSSLSITLDFIQLCPLDGWRVVQRVGEGVDYQESWVIDDISGFVYVLDAGGDRRGNVVTVGQPLMLIPGKLQRLYFLIHKWTGDTAPITDRHSAQVYYRPRVLTVG